MPNAPILHSYESKAPVFYFEEFGLDLSTNFDAELDHAVSKYALERGTLSGYCNVAGAVTVFKVKDPNLREDVSADVSGSRSRHRQIVVALSIAMFDNPTADLKVISEAINARNASILLAETASPLAISLKDLVRPDLLVSTEYFGPQYASGALVNGIRHEDLQQTSFQDEQFDFVITSDVFEHIPDAEAAERETLRILKPGGFHCFTVPLDPVGENDHILAALRDDGSIEYFAEPSYHGDPLRPEGVLVYRIFSVKEMTERLGRLDAQCRTFRLWSKEYGLLGPGCWVHIVRKTL